MSELYEYDIIVVGDEPAGLWCLKTLEEQKTTAVKPRVAWVSLKPASSPFKSTPIAQKAILEKFGFPLRSTFFPEMISPKWNLVWKPERIKKRFPSLPDLPHENVLLMTAFKKDWVKALRGALEKSPDLYFYSQALWKALGRSEPAISLSQFAWMYHYPELAEYEPEAIVPSNVDRYQLNGSVIESFQKKKEGTHLVFNNGTALFSKKWIWNLDIQDLNHLWQLQPEGAKWILLDPNKVLAENSLYPVFLRTQAKTCPPPMRNLTLYLDDDCMPEIQSEVWPISINRKKDLEEMTLWVQASRQVLLESIQANTLKGLKSLTQLIPNLLSGMYQNSLPLDSDCHANSDSRLALEKELLEDRREIYSQSLTHTMTRHPHFYSLLPVVGSHLPYPLGTLVMAQKWYEDWLLKQKKPKPLGPQPVPNG